MRASVLHGVEDLRFEEVDDPEPGPGEIALRPAHNGICGSDLHMYYATGPVAPTVLGHEFAGTVTALGEGVTDLAVGTRIAVRPIDACGHCQQCAAGNTHRCFPPRFIGCNVAGGGLAERSVVPRVTAFPLPETVSLELGALVEPMAVSFNGIVQSRIEAGGTAVVLGGGPIGIGVLLGLRAIGVTDTVVVEPSTVRRDVVDRLGAADVLDPTTDDVAAVIRARTAGRGADAVFECAGVANAFNTALSIVTPGGRVVIVALYEEPVTFSPFPLITGELEVVGSMAYAPGVFERVVDLMAAGHYATDGWVEHIAWDDIVGEGFTPLRQGRRAKVLVDVT